MSDRYSREEKPYAEARIKKSHGIYGTMNEKPQVAGVQNIRDKWKNYYSGRGQRKFDHHYICHLHHPDILLKALYLLLMAAL